MKNVLQFGPFRLDTGAKQLWRGSEEVPLGPKALDLLIHFAERPGELLTREQLFEAVWHGVWVDDHALSVQIRDIRRALGDDVREPKYIETRHRRGYRFKAPVTRLLESPDEPKAVSTQEPTQAYGTTLLEGPAPGRFALSIPETHYARSGNVNIAYQVVGSGPVDLVFVMGWVSHLEYFWTEPRFANFLRRLASFSRLILFDKRGTGLSDRVPLDELPTIEQRMDDVRAVMDAVGSKRAVICGVSEGGCMSAVMAATYPERLLGLVMIGTFSRRSWAPDYPWGPTSAQRDQFLREIQEQWGGPVGLEERAGSLAADPAFRNWWATYLRMGSSPGAAIGLTRMNAEIDIRGVLPLVRVPTLVIHRTHDLCLKVEEGRYVASLIPGARFVELPGDHLPFVGDQESILREVEHFVAQVQHGFEQKSVLATVLAAEFVASPLLPSELDSFIRAELRHSRGVSAFQTREKLAATFDGPVRAVRFAHAVRQQAADFGVRMRAGLHVGECVAEPGQQLSGAAVEVVSQIRERAAPGELLVSGTLRDLVAGSGISFQSWGRLEVPGLGEWQVLRVERA